jgi:uncharacterized membrane protein YeaQ/YmgE (transglycosylase-associated protein family)
MSILSWILFGLVAGAIAKAIHPGKDPGGWLITIIIGIVGAMLGGALGVVLFHRDVTGWNLTSFLLAVGGSIILLWIYSAVRGRRAA